MPLRYLFVDMNAYFASVEQHDHPEWRNRPLVVVPVEARTSSCIAVNYLAKARGVRVGSPVWEAEKLCPGVVCAPARPERYVEIHKEIVRAVGRCIPVTKVMSIDEMACSLLGAEREPAKAEDIARSIKAELRHSLGEVLTCSIGVGPNVMLAKIAGDMKKPDGLTVIRPEELPDRLYPLKITDFPGIGPRMEKRFHRYGVTTTRELLQLKESALARVWGSRVHAERWFHLLQGEDVPDLPTRRRTVGHSHVLPPAQRTPDGSRAVMVRLIHKACARLRSIGYWAGAMAIGLRFTEGVKWHTARQLPHCQDTLQWLLAFGEMWDERPTDAGPPLQVWMTLTDLKPAEAATPSLIPQERQATALSHAMDAINRKFGKHAVRFGGISGAEGAAPMRIPFNHIPKINPATN
ncbi:MAG: DNA polymerase [Fimbriiglobus sp.]|jgi:DNA polymerase-4|nr:DNA polymerase [Fimbriiglobus sp.]